MVLAVDTSMIAVRYILSQEGEDGKRYPNHFGLIRLMEVESHYSQAKLELYRLFCSLRAVRIFIFGVANLTVEMDAKYVKGMINNPDLQPNVTINQWITGILLFTFWLVHIPTIHHTGADGLSHCLSSEDDPPENDNFKDWLDNAYSFSISLLNNHVSLPGNSAHFSRNLPTNDHQASVFVSSDPDTTMEDPELPCSPKALVKEAWINKVRDFLGTRDWPPDLSDADYISFINAGTWFFLLDVSLYHREPHRRHQLVIPIERHYGLIREAHNTLRYKGVFSVWTCLLLCFWCPMLVDVIKWYIRTCHQCQIRQTQKLHILPTVPVIGSLFHKVHINMMVMPRSGGYRYIVQARCALTAYLEWRMLWSKNTSSIASFIFEEILCHWGAVAELVTDNGTPYVQALDTLATRYGIRHIRISLYNSQANGIVKRCYYDVREAIVKSTLGGEVCWSSTAHSVFWAERFTILKLTGLSPYFMVHGVEPLFSFDLTEAILRVPVSETDPISSTTLIAWRA